MRHKGQGRILNEFFLILSRIIDSIFSWIIESGKKSILDLEFLSDYSRIMLRLSIDFIPDYGGRIFIDFFSDAVGRSNDQQ